MIVELITPSKTNPIAPPPPGIYRNIPADEYHRWDAISASKLKRMTCPARLRYSLDNPDDADSKALFDGRAIHDAVLLPQTFQAAYAVAPEVDRRTKAGKDAWAEFVKAHDGATVITPDLYATCLGISASLRADPVAGPLLAGRGGNEVSIRWTDKQSGLACKARIDRVTEYMGFTTHVDIKTTQDADPDQFRWEVRKHKYHLQAAFYLDGCEALSGGKRRFVFIAVEKTPPYLCSVCELDEADNQISLQSGRDLYRPLLDTIKDCQTTGVWPGYGGIWPLTIGG